ncbi:unnamed protein product, partial [marine sediment metagenome]
DVDAVEDIVFFHGICQNCTLQSMLVLNKTSPFVGEFDSNLINEGTVFEI